MDKQPPTLEELATVLSDLTFIAETVAHMRGFEWEILPTTEKARELLSRIPQVSP